MAAAMAERSVPPDTFGMIRGLAVVAALAVAGCNGSLLNLSGQEQSQSTLPGEEGAALAQPVDQMSTAVAIRDAACYNDFELANSAIESKLSNSIQNITTSGDVGEDTMRNEMILGLRFNANLQKRLAFDTLEECLR